MLRPRAPVASSAGRMLSLAESKALGTTSLACLICAQLCKPAGAAGILQIHGLSRYLHEFNSSPRPRNQAANSRPRPHRAVFAPSGDPRPDAEAAITAGPITAGTG